MKVKIIPNPEKQWAVELAKEVEHLLVKYGHAVEETGADATVCIGGDGTILYSNHMNMVEGPVIGIGSKSSYICQLIRDEWKEQLPEMLEKRKTVEVMALEASVDGKMQTAINDFVIHSKDYRVVPLEVEDKKGRYKFLGDGIIVSSPIGSASYAYSAGGTMLGPFDRKICVVPICPYRRVFSPTVMDEDASVKISSDRDCAFIVDGIFLQDLKKGGTVVIKKGKDITFFEGVGHYKQE